MLQFILSVILLVALGTILYLVARSLPRIGEEETPVSRRGFWERWVTSEIPERADRIFSDFQMKLFRKLKVWLLKFDNVISARLTKIKHKHKIREGQGNGFDDI